MDDSQSVLDAVEFIRRSGDLYRAARRGAPGAPWDRGTALALAERVVQVRDQLGVPRYTFTSCAEEPHCNWPWGDPALMACAAARASHGGHLEDLLITCSLLCNGFDWAYGDGPPLVAGYVALLPVIGVMTAPLDLLSGADQFDVPSWFDDDGFEKAFPVCPSELGAAREDAGNLLRRILLRPVRPWYRDLVLAVRATLGRELEPDEQRGDVGGLLRYAGEADRDGPNDEYELMMLHVGLVYLAARDSSLLLEASPDEVRAELGWLEDWISWDTEGWPPFPAPSGVAEVDLPEFEEPSDGRWPSWIGAPPTADVLEHVSSFNYWQGVLDVRL